MNIAEYGQYLDELEHQYLIGNVENVVEKSLQILKPPTRIPIVEWAEQNIVLDETSPIPGPFRIRNSPHLKEIFEAIEDPQVRKVTIMGSAQIGKTLFEMIVWAYIVVQDPCPMLIMQPTDREIKSFALHKLEPLIESSEILRSRVAKKKRGNSNDSSTRLKMYPGGWTEIISGTSKGTTRQRSVRITIADDIDALEMAVSSEGDHVINLEKRTAGFKYNYLHINISTPRIEGQSRIEARYKEGSMGKFHVKCPHCGTEQTLEESQLLWDKDTDIMGNVTEHYPETARVACRGCGYAFSEKERVELLQKGFYIHEHPERKEHRSFWLNQIMSTISDLKTVVSEKIRAEQALENGDDETYESYVNNTLGLPYKRVKGKETDAKYLIDRREDYINLNNPKIPNGVLLITSAVDVQAGSGSKPARLEIETWGWGNAEEGWIIDKLVFPGNIEKDEVWDKLNHYWANKIFERADGVKLKISRKGIDSGFLTQTVYDFCAGRFLRENILALKGAVKYGAPLVPKKLSEVNQGKTMLMMIGTQAAKTILFERLNTITEPGAKYLHHTKAFCDVEYYEQLTAEHAVTKTVGLNQYIVYEPKKRGLANEALDLLVMNFALMKSLNPNFKAIEESIEKHKSKAEEEPKKAAKKKVIIKKRKNFVTDF